MLIFLNETCAFKVKHFHFLAQWLSRYRLGSIKTMRAQDLWFEARPDRTLSPGSGQKMGARGPSSRLASAKLVKYGIFIYLFLKTEIIMV